MLIRRPMSRRPQIELLEDRTVPAVAWYNANTIYYFAWAGEPNHLTVTGTTLYDPGIGIIADPAFFSNAEGDMVWLRPEYSAAGIEIHLSDMDDTAELFIGYSATVFAGEGYDTIIGGTGSNLVYGENGNDVIHGSNVSDTLYGGEGIDTIYCYDGDDVASGNSGNDYVNGGVGDDWVSGGGDADVVIGGVGNDIITAFGKLLSRA